MTVYDRDFRWRPRRADRCVLAESIVSSTQIDEFLSFMTVIIL